MYKFTNRRHAGKYLAEKLKTYANNPEGVVLALPRGGVPVAYEIAKALALPLDVFIVRKLGVPGQDELAMGALASEEVVILNDEIISKFHIQQREIDAVIKAEKKELQRREVIYRSYPQMHSLQGKTVLLVDDGIATGFTLRAAIYAIRQQNPLHLVVASPVGAWDTCNELAKLVDKIVCPLQPVDFYAVGAWYEEFSQTTDEEVCYLLKEAFTVNKSQQMND